MSLIARSLRSAITAIVLLAVVAVAVFASASTTIAAPTATSAKLYLKLRVTEPTTTVGQQPKFVFIYGNTGGKTVSDLAFDCRFSDNFDNKLEFVSSTFDSSLAQYQNLIPGQNLSDEDTYRAIEAGTAKIRCRLVGTEQGTGREVFSPFSSWVTVTIKP